MKVLLDENLSHRLRHHLENHQVATAFYAGFAGLKNGQLLNAAEEAGFDVLVTADKTLQYEQNLNGRKLAIVSLSANSWQVIEPHVGKIAAAVGTALPGSLTQVSCGAFVRPRKVR